MNEYELKKGESLAEGYYVQAVGDPDFESLVVEVNAPDGILAILSFEKEDEDVMVHWPVDPEWERAQTGSFTDIMRALEFGKERVLRNRRRRNRSSRTGAAPP